jgi:hypothetical protein
LRREFNLNQRLNLQFKVECFNLFNHPNFEDPVNVLSSNLFGQSTQMLGRSLGSGGINGGLIPLYQIGGPRSTQLALKINSKFAAKRRRGGVEPRGSFEGIVRLTTEDVIEVFLLHTSLMRTSVSLYHRHRFPAEIISHCVWLYTHRGHPLDWTQTH